MVDAYLDFTAQRRDLLAGQTTLPAILECYLQATAQDNPGINAVLETFADEARAQAASIQAKVEAGTAGPLAGLILGLKDNLCYAGHRVGAASKILEGYVSPFSATAVQRLLDADALVMGRLNCDEFAMGSSNENSAYGPVRNPLNPSLVPGGSSGGSAAAVRAGFCTVALGSDTGGSIRQPASFCDVYGLKPTYGRISRYGLLAFASSLDQIGPIGLSLADLAAVTQVMAGRDELDTTTADEPVPDLLAALQAPPPQGLKLAYLAETVDNPALSPAIRQAFMDWVQALQQAGHTVEAIAFPYLEHVVPTYTVLATAEASSNLARYDGIRYGYRAPSAEDLHEVYLHSRTQGFGPEVRRRILSGTFVLSAGYYDAYHGKAQQVRRLLANWVDTQLQQYAFLLSPTTPTPPFAFGEKGADPIAMYLSDIYTVLANLGGHPALHLPLGGRATDQPFGLQVMAARYAEGELFRFAQQVVDLVLGDKAVR